MYKISFMTLSILLFASSALALNRELWDSLTQDQQNAYLIGAFEMILTGEPGEAPQDYKNILWKCYNDGQFDLNQLREFVLQSYQDPFYKNGNLNNLGAGLHLRRSLQRFCNTN